MSEYFKIGYVAKTHGLKGEVTFMLGPDCPEPEAIESLFIESNGQLAPYFIESISVKGVKAYAKLEGVNTPEQAQLLKGSSLYLLKSQRTKLGKGQFYNDEIEGFEVEDKEKGILGLVSQVVENGPGRYIIVLYHTKEIMIPVNGPFIKNVNKTQKKIIVELPEGFLEL